MISSKPASFDGSVGGVVVAGGVVGDGDGDDDGDGEGEGDGEVIGSSNFSSSSISYSSVVLVLLDSI